MELWQWAWIIVAFVLMPLSALGLQKLDLEENREPETGRNIAGGALIAAFWPAILILGLAALIFVAPTWYLLTVTTTKHQRRKREAETEAEVLAKIEADRKAEDERIKREIEGEPQPVPELNLPHKNPQGRLRRSHNTEFLRENMARMRREGYGYDSIRAYARLARKESLFFEGQWQHPQYDATPRDEIPPSTNRTIL